MPSNKNAVIRYQALNNCFRNPGRRYDIDSLLVACNEALMDIDSNSTGIKRRQIYEDIKFMQDSYGYNAPIEVIKDGKKAYYQYSDMNFSINNQPLNRQEAQQLKEALITLGRFKGLPHFEWIEELNTRLEYTFSLKTNEKVIGFEENSFLKGIEHISTLYNAITNKQVLKIKYQSFKHNAEIVFIIHSYYLKQYNSRWFIFGLNEELNIISNLSLDRIQEIEAIKMPFKDNLNINFDEYFDDIIGVSIPENKEVLKIILKIDKKLWPYIKSKPIHGSQKIKSQSEQAVFVEIELILNYELESLLLSYGAELEIIEPERLRNNIYSKVSDLYKKYNSNKA